MEWQTLDLGRSSNRKMAYGIENNPNTRVVMSHLEIYSGEVSDRKYAVK